MEREDLDLQLLECEENMDKAVSVTSDAMSKVRTGRASTGILEDVKVDYYGVPTPLKQLASLSIPEPRTISIAPFDPSSTSLIEKAIMQSNLGLTPNVSGDRLIRVNIPELTEERRRDLAKVARGEAENGRIAVRNIRREANDLIKKAEKGGTIGEDDARGMLEEIQEKTDAHIKTIDAMLAKKEADLLKV